MATQPTHIKVATKRGQRQSFWRSGLQFTREPRVIALDTLEKGQLKQIKGDPRLAVETLTQSSRPADQAEAITEIVEAIKTLAADPANWTGKGLPQVAALEQALGWPVTAAERDTAWSQIAGNDK